MQILDNLVESVRATKRSDFLPNHLLGIDAIVGAYKNFSKRKQEKPELARLNVAVQQSWSRLDEKEHNKVWWALYGDYRSEAVNDYSLSLFTRFFMYANLGVLATTIDWTSPRQVGGIALGLAFAQLVGNNYFRRSKNAEIEAESSIQLLRNSA